MSVVEMTVAATLIEDFDAKAPELLPGKEVSRNEEFPGLWVLLWDNPEAPEDAVSMVPWWLKDAYGEPELGGIDYYDAAIKRIKSLHTKVVNAAEVGEQA